MQQFSWLTPGFWRKTFFKVWKEILMTESELAEATERLARSEESS